LKCVEILNSDVGIIGSLKGECETLLDNISRLPKKNVEYQVNQFKNRLDNIVEYQAIIKSEPVILKLIDSINSHNMTEVIEKLSDIFYVLGNKVLKKVMTGLPKRYVL